jgi:hypothetical protein
VERLAGSATWLSSFFEKNPARRGINHRFADPLLWNLFRLTDEVNVDCWHIVESRHWFIRMAAKDYDAELEQLDRELSAELDG